jgi:hypothetical protein
VQASEITITLFAKSGGPLTKRISLSADGSLVSDGSNEVSAMSVRRCFRPHVIEIARFLAPLISCCDTVSLFEEVNRRWPNLSFSDFLGAALEPRGAHDDPRTRSR